MDVLNRPAEEFVNDPSIETAWVMKAVKHMEVHFNILCSVDPKHLRLTKFDEEIYSEFRQDFRDIEINHINVEAMKNGEGKEKWREFCQKFEQVPDFNFGTLLRISSDDDYNNENTVFVPRIQFYAIEVARNKEGCNDKIRLHFTPNGKELTDRSELCFLSITLSRIKQLFDSEMGFKCTVKKENGSVLKGDLSVFLLTECQETEQETIRKISDCLEDQKCSVRQCRILGKNRLQLTLDKYSLYERILGCEKEDVAFNRSQTALLLLPGFELRNDIKDAEDIRTLLLSALLTKILLATGYQVYTSPNLSSESDETVSVPSFEECQRYCPSFKTLQDECFQKINSRCKTVNDKLYLRAEEVPQDSTNLVSNVSCSKEDILVKDGQIFSHVYQMAVYNKHILEKHVYTTDVVYHVINQRRSGSSFQVAFLLQQITGKKLKQICFLHNTVHIPKNVSVQDIKRFKRKTVESALIHKYGKTISSEPSWVSVLNILSDTCLKMEVLSVSPTTPVSIQEDSKLGCFVQYNCARMSQILSQYDSAVKSGQYSHPISLDYNLLKKDEEWQLFWNYILAYPLYLKELTEFKGASLQLQKICNMLHCLSRDFSQYYRKVRILTNVPHQFPVMHCRISLLRSLLQLMENGLHLLGLAPLRKM